MRKSDILWLVSAFLSLFLGALFYIFIRTEPTYITELISFFIDIPLLAPLSIFIEQNEVRLLINNYAADALWMFSFTIGLNVLLTGSSRLDRVSKAFFYSLVSGIFFESFQYFGLVRGTFDWLDIFTFILTALVAAALCLIFPKKELGYA